jgi:TonB-linked SusC/RagA family outer membrane protein
MRWFARSCLLVATVLVAAVPAAAQQQQQQNGSISGRVIRADTRQPVSGAQIFVVGTRLGSLTGAEGLFVIQNVPAGSHTVRLQVMGFHAEDQAVSVAPGVTATVEFEVREQAIAIDPVVVTALGIERNEKSLGYAVQTVSSVELARSPEVNLVQALAGQTAGVQVVQSSGRPGASSRITIRGESSFTGSGQPLFIVDGVPISTELDATGRGALGYGSAGNRAMDLDMENVEDISVLRGAAATALYGSRAAGGAVVIRTKQGRAGAPLRFTVSSEASFARPLLGGYVTDFAAGSRGYFCNGRIETQGGWCQPGYPSNTPNAAATTGNNWGPHKDSIAQIVFDSVGEVRFADAREDFYQTAQSIQNSLRATGAMGELGTFSFGISHLNQGDITPKAKLERLNLSANVNLRLSSYLQSNTSVQRIYTDNPWTNDSWNSIHRLLVLIPPTRDIREAWNPDGTPVMWGANNPHYQWVAENEYEQSTVSRWIVSQNFTARLFGPFMLANTWGLDTYIDERQRFQNERPWRTAEGLPSGGTRQQKITRTSIDDNLILNMDRVRFGESPFTVSGLVGGNVYMTENSNIEAEGTDINIPDFYNVSNFSTQDVTARLPTMRRLVGVYGQATIDYQDWVFLTLTGRNDWSSTLPEQANNYFYPSASLGFILSDVMNCPCSVLDYAKLRFSAAKVGNDAPPYSLTSRYFTAEGIGADNAIQQFSGPGLQFPFRDQNGFFQGTQLGNPDLRPESTVETEVGVELRLLDGRARVDASYYNKKSYDQIFSVPSSAVTGYTSIVRNAGDLRNRGIELSLQARPIQTNDLIWNVRANWTRNRNDVLELAEGVTSISLAGYGWPQIRIMEDEGYGVIWGYGFKRNCVDATAERPLGRDGACFSGAPQGALLLDDNGMPLRTDEQINLGNVQPDWLANFSTDVRFKNFTLSGLIDVKKGGKILNFETQYTVNNGRSKITETRGTPILFDGYNVNTGEKNAVSVMRGQDFYGSVYGFDRHENQIEPAGFIKLREVTIAYDLPQRFTARFDVQSASLYLTGRNLKVWSDFSMGDPESDLYGGGNAGGQYFRQFPAPQTRGLALGIRANF